MSASQPQDAQPRQAGTAAAAAGSLLAVGAPFLTLGTTFLAQGSLALGLPFLVLGMVFVAGSAGWFAAYARRRTAAGAARPDAPVVDAQP